MFNTQNTTIILVNVAPAWVHGGKKNKQAIPWRLLHEILTLVSLGACPRCRTTFPTPHHLELPSKCKEQKL